MSRIGSNITSLIAQRRVAETSDRLSRSFERLASGQRINRASDDAASLAIATQLDVGARIYSRAVLNINDGISVLSIGEKAVEELKGISIRQRELATQAANGTYTGIQRSALNREADELTREYQRIIESTKFNGLSVFNGDSPLTIQVGSGSEATLSIGPISFGAQGSSTATTPQQDGTFGAVSSFSLVSNWDYTASDVNGDGNQDLIVAAAPAVSAVVVYAGNGSGGFAPIATLTGATNPLRVEVTDLDGDGRPEIAALDWTGYVNIWRNQGNGSFSAAASYDVDGGGFKFGDINGDTKLDLIGSGESEGWGWGTYRLGDGVGGFSSPMTTFATSGWCGNDIAVGDVDRDGDNDLVFLTSQDTMYDVPANIAIFKNNGSGGFSTFSQYDLGSVYALDIALGDVNSDSNLDLILNPGTDIQVRLGTGDGNFASSSNVGLGGGTNGFDLGDVDDDGDADIVVAVGGTARHAVLTNNAGSFSVSQSYLVGGGADRTVLRDFDNDGFLDIVGKYGDSFRLQLGQGTYVETPAQGGGGAATPLDLTTIEGAKSAMDDLDERLVNLSSKLDVIGAMQSRLSAGLRAITVTHESYLGASARIKSTDVAEEAATSMRLRLLQDIGASILGQANQQPQMALMLIR